MAITTQQTTFTRDILGRYMCNTFGEAALSRPFDVIIVGGGTFGLALAQDLFDRTRQAAAGQIVPPDFRILVLEAGPLALPAHAQDIPNLQLATPGGKPDGGPPPTAGAPLPATRQELMALGLSQTAVLENWGMPWNSSVRFGGLAYCLGGRSLYFGGWSPTYLKSEMHTSPAGAIGFQNLWPQTVADDLTERFFTEAAEQTGTDTSNDYINGELHDYYRKKLFDTYGKVPFAVGLSELPDYSALPRYRDLAGRRTRSHLRRKPYPGFEQALKLDAPLAVQIRTVAGSFPFNKFSSVPLGMTAARQAHSDSGGNDAAKRLMIVPNCHVKSLRTRTYTVATGATVQEVDGIDTGDGFLDLSGPVAGNVNRRPVVILAAGAIESARLALLSVGNAPNASLMGSNLQVHLRKNVQFTAPMPAGLDLREQELTALLVRCRSDIGGTPVHFHFQISASALPAGRGAGASDALLFRNVPDLDNLEHLAATAPGEVDVSIRAVGEMLPGSGNSVTVPFGTADLDEYGMPRALVNIGRSGADVQAMQEMDQVIEFLAENVFGVPVNAAGVAPDGIGTSFHESGTLRMGDNPAASVVNPDGQFHFVTNLYGGDASVLPTCGSANPVINGVALRRRLARHLAPEGDGAFSARPFVAYPVRNPPPAGTTIRLFDDQTLANWRMAGRGTFHVIDGALQSVPSFDLGLLWCTIPAPCDYRLELEFFIRTFRTNSGVFFRFRNPDGATNPDGTMFSNPAWAAVRTGFEAQIDNAGAPDGAAKHRTGVIDGVNYPDDPAPDPAMPPPTPGDFANPQDALVMGWNQYRIEVRGDVFTVNLNGIDTAKYTNTDPNRGQAADPGYVGLQAYSNYSYPAAFRNIRITAL
jgi:choline dehydrogenase-like flavoprotein